MKNKATKSNKPHISQAKIAIYSISIFLLGGFSGYFISSYQNIKLNEAIFNEKSALQEEEQKKILTRKTINEEKEELAQISKDFLNVAFIKANPQALSEKNDNNTRCPYPHFIELAFSIKNTGSKDIAGIKGAIEMKDDFNNTNVHIPINIDSTIKSGTLFPLSYRYCDFKKYFSQDHESLKIKFYPSRIELYDGSFYALPSENGSTS